MWTQNTPWSTQHNYRHETYPGPPSTSYRHETYPATDTKQILFHPALTTDIKHTLVHLNLVTGMKSPVHTNGESVQTSAVHKPSVTLTFLTIGTMFLQPVVHKTELAQPPADVSPTMNTLSATLVLSVARVG